MLWRMPKPKGCYNCKLSNEGPSQLMLQRRLPKTFPAKLNRSPALITEEERLAGMVFVNLSQNQTNRH
jgi:hypothetical protein